MIEKRLSKQIESSNTEIESCLRVHKFSLKFDTCDNNPQFFSAEIFKEFIGSLAASKGFSPKKLLIQGAKYLFSLSQNFAVELAVSLSIFEVMQPARAIRWADCIARSFFLHSLFLTFHTIHLNNHIAF